jgi:hypothetical protein
MQPIYLENWTIRISVLVAAYSRLIFSQSQFRKERNKKLSRLMMQQPNTVKNWSLRCALNSVRQNHDWPQWAFLELASLEQVKDLRKYVLDEISRLARPAPKKAAS